MNHFYPDGSGLFQDDSTPIHKAQGLSVWFDEDEHYIVNVL